MSESLRIAAANVAKAKELGRLQPEQLEAVNATIYTRGGFSYTRTEVRLVRVTCGPYAQYQRALKLEWLAKGKRKPEGVWLSYDPKCVILRGQGHPVPRHFMEDKGGGVSESRASCFSPQWCEEFAQLIDPYIAANPSQLLADYRGFDTRAR